jgi:hypothetical protein
MIMAKKKTPQRKAPGSGFSTQAELEAFVRFNPQLSGLAQMLSQTRGEAETRARDAIAGGEAISQSARMARADTDQDYKSATASTQARNSTLAAELGKLSPAAESYKAAGLSEASAGLTRLTAAGSRAKQEFSSRSADAVAAGRYGAKAARDQGASDARSIMDKIQGVTAEAGAYQAGRVGELTEARRQRANELAKTRAANAQSERNSIRSSGKDPDTGKAIPGGSLDPDGDGVAGEKKKPKSNLATPTQGEDLQAAIGKAKRYAASLKGIGKQRSAVAKDLVLGREAKDIFDRDAYRDLLAGKAIDGETAKDPKSGKIDKTLARNIATTKLPAIPSFDELAASVALDIVYDGGISKVNRAKLHGPGGGKNPRYKLRDLGLPTEPPKPKKPKPKPSLNNGASGRANVGTR